MDIVKMLEMQQGLVADGMRGFVAEQDRKAKKADDQHQALVDLAALGKANVASEFHKRLMAMVSQFDTNLDQAHEVGVQLVTFGQTVTFHVTEIGYQNPSLITFAGVLENGDPVMLIQHVSQISFLLTKLPRKIQTSRKRCSGFRHTGRKRQEKEPAAAPSGA